MFAQFFIKPLMKKEAMEREREAVDSEYQMSLPSDYARKQQIFGSVAKDKHPLGKFMWGNKESLLMGGVCAKFHFKIQKFINFGHKKH